MKAQQAWQAARGQLQMEMPRAAFDTWVRNAEFVSYEDGSFILGVPNAYACDWLQSRLSSTVTRLLTGIMNRTIEVRFVVWQNGNSPVSGSSPPMAERKTRFPTTTDSDMKGNPGRMRGGTCSTPPYTRGYFFISHPALSGSTTATEVISTRAPGSLRETTSVMAAAGGFSRSRSAFFS